MTIAPRRRAHASALALPLAALLLGGCASTTTNTTDAAPASPFGAPRPPAETWTGDAQDLRLFDGRTGTPLTWDDLLLRVADADAVIVGEQHDDAAGHAFQAALVGDAIAQAGGGMLALEMLERDEQPLVDDWLDGVIDAEQLAELTGSTDWSGEDSWAAWYQPILDAARDAGGRIVAANAPRRYVRLTRTDGFDRVAGLPAPRRGFVELPSDGVDDDGYWERFVSIMTSHSTAGDGEGLSDERLARLRSTFRAQRTWDATMGDSVARALGRGAPVVLLMIGQFHSDFDGATVLELEHRRPDARVLTISMQRRSSAELDEADRDRADIIVHTGARADG